MRAYGSFAMVQTSPAFWFWLTVGRMGPLFYSQGFFMKRRKYKRIEEPFI